MDKRLYQRSLTVGFVIILISRLLYTFVVQVVNPNGIYLFDSWQYLNIAKNLFDHGAFSQIPDLPNVPDATRTPIYPFYITLFHFLKLPGFSIVITQSLIAAYTGTLLAHIVSTTVSNRLFWAAIGIYVLDLPSLFFANTVLTETVFTALLLTSILFCSLGLKKERLLYFGVGGVLLAAATLTRPIALHLIWILPIGFLVYRLNLWKSALVLLGVGILCISPWAIRNQVTFGTWSVSTITEVNLLFHTATAIKSKHSTKTQKQEEYYYRDIMLEDVNFYETSSVPVFQDRARKEFIHQIKTHPTTFFTIWGKGLVSFFFKPLRSYFQQQLGGGQSKNNFGMMSSLKNLPQYLRSLPKEEVVLVVIQWIHLCVLYFGVITLLVKKRLMLTKTQWMLLLLIAYFAATSAVSEVDSRFRVPIIPFLVWLSVSGYYSLLSKNEQNQKETS